MLPPWTHLRTALHHALPALHAISDSDAYIPPAPGKWSPKEVIGHLIDSASNNHGRFVRAQLQEHMRFERYAQDDWVRVQHYRDASWTELIDLWHRINLHLARVMEAAPPEQLNRPRTDHNLHERAFRSLPVDTPATLGWFMQDYVEHLQHHLRQVLGAVRILSFAPVSALPVPRWSAYAKAFLATLFWGCSFIAIRFALASATPYGLVWLRNILAAVLLFGILRLRGGPLLPERADRGRVVLLGLLFGVHLLAQAYAMQFTSSMHAGWIIAFIPAVVAVGAWLFQRQRLRVVGWLGISVATAGVLLLTNTSLTHFTDAGLGDLIMLGTTFTWAAYTLLTGGPAQRNGGLRIAASALAISVLPAVAMASVFGTWAAAPTAGSMLAIVFLGAGASALAMWTYTDAVAELGAERAAAFQYAQPLITMAAAALLLAEPLTPEIFLGGPVVLAGVWLVQRGKKGL